MITPTKTDIGRCVLYTGNTYPGGEIERGVITSFNKQTVFVRYGADVHPKGTNPDDLQWEDDEPDDLQWEDDEWTIGAASDAWDGGFAHD